MNVLGFDLPLWLILLLAVVVVLYRWSTRNFGLFKEMGIPGQRPWPLIGTQFSMISQGMVKSDMMIIKKYGPIIGSFLGTRPELIISDTEILKEVLIKQFSKFRNRQTAKMGTPILDENVSNLEDDHWKYVRSLISPTFTGGKLRKMVPMINKCCQNLVTAIKEAARTGDNWECKEYAAAYTMDVIAATTFGLELNSLRDKNNEFTRRAKEILNLPMSLLLIFFVCPSFLPYAKKWFGVEMVSNETEAFFSNIVKQTIKEREESPEQVQKDFLNLMMNARSEEGSDKGLTENEVLANSFIFFLAGYSTTADAVKFSLYNLATHQEVQDKCYEEICEVLQDKEPEYDDVKKLSYLQMCLDETLRMYPPAPRTDRVASETVDINGLHITKGMVVSIPVYWMHFDPSAWDEPEKFNPERFTPEAKEARHPCQYLPFGLGPRNCVAQRLALHQTKLALIHIIRKFRLVTSEKTEIPLKLQKMSMEAVNGVWIKAELRAPASE